MKKIISCLLAVSVVIMSFVTVHCEDNIKVTLNGKPLEFDVPPQIIDERTLVPMRVIFEALGADVDWEAETQTINAKRENDLFYISMRVGDPIIHKVFTSASLPTVNENQIQLDVPPQIIDDRTLVPVRAVSECLGCDVKWDDESKTVVIESASDGGDVIAPTVSPADLIEYNSESEREASYMKDFKLVDVAENSDGNYDITYTVQTYFEGRGDVTVKFRCLDENGDEVDRFGGIFRGTDYTWSAHEAKATISGKTKFIELIAEK